MAESRQIADVRTDEMNGARADLLAEATAELCVRARCYLQEPGDAAWDNLVAALRRAYGDDEAYDLLRAVTIHVRTHPRR
ncbi:MAG: hypothetical protein M3153_05975 [Chloroflexota bacterium]|nr:hypothetical protein [Chloroflexota bacterium]